MSLLSNEFENEEREFVNEMIKKGSCFETIAQIRRKYHEDFHGNREEFEDFKSEVIRKSKPEA